MKIKRAIAAGALLWILIFFEVSVLMFGFNLKPGQREYYTIHYMILAILTIITALIYFRKANAGLKNGILAGIFFAITGIILDAAITVPLFVKSYSFFVDKFLWFGIIGLVILVALVGWIKGAPKKKVRKKTKRR